MVLAVLALCMQLWAGQATAAHFGQAVVDGTWRNDLAALKIPRGWTPTPCRRCASASIAPLAAWPAASPAPFSGRCIERCSAAQCAPQQRWPETNIPSATRLRPPAQAPPAMPPPPGFGSSHPAATKNDSSYLQLRFSAGGFFMPMALRFTPTAAAGGPLGIAVAAGRPTPPSAALCQSPQCPGRSPQMSFQALAAASPPKFILLGSASASAPGRGQQPESTGPCSCHARR